MSFSIGCAIFIDNCVCLISILILKTVFYFFLGFNVLFLTYNTKSTRLFVYGDHPKVIPVKSATIVITTTTQKHEKNMNYGKKSILQIQDPDLTLPQVDPHAFKWKSNAIVSIRVGVRFSEFIKTVLSNTSQFYTT